jgi:hypothetical protein
MNNTAPAPALTVKESALLAAITEGMDEPGCGWLHELADANRSTNAVLGSLIKKGLVHSHKDTEGVPGVPSYWVELTPAGEALAPAAAPAPELTTLPLIRKIEAAAPAPGSSRAVILQDGAVPVLNFKPGRFDGPYVAGDGIDLWSFSSEAAALSYSQALRREGAVPVALAENDLGQWRPILPGEAVAPAAPAPAGPAPELPEFVTYSQQQQQPQQPPAAAFKLPPASQYDAPCPPKAAAPTCLVNAGPRARSTAPSHLPDEGVRLLDRFELQFDSVLTVGTSNTKIGKGQAVAHSAGFFGLPAKQLSTAIYGALDAPVAARGRLEAVRRLALDNGLGAAAQRLDACPWASDGCRDGCLVFSGRNAMGTAPAACKARRSLARLWAPNVFSVVLLWAIAREHARAQRMGLPLSLRLKGTDDLPHHLQTFNLYQDEAAILQRRYGLPVTGGYGVTLPEVLSLALQDGSIRWYEYSKAPLGGSQGLLDLRGCGIDVTASLAADRRDGARAAVGAVRAGFRLAVPLDIPRGAALPAELLLAPTLGLPAPAGSPGFGRVPADDRPVRLLCIDGDKTDLRWLDQQGPQPGGFDGVAVMLRTKRSRGRGAAAAAFSLQPSADWQALKGGGFAKLIP